MQWRMDHSTREDEERECAGAVLSHARGEKRDGTQSIFSSLNHPHITTLPFSHASFTQGLVPGTDETFEATEQRLRQAAKQRIRDNLGEKQQRTWDRSHTEPLIPRAGTGGVVSVGFSSVNVFDSSDTPK